MEKKKKKSSAKRVTLSQADSTVSIPDTNVLNLREIMLQREVDRLRQELERRKRGGFISRLNPFSARPRSTQPAVLKQPPPQRLEVPQSRPTSVRSQGRPRPTSPDEVMAGGPRSSLKLTLPRFRLETSQLKSLSGFAAVALLLILLVFGLWGYQKLLEVRSRVLAVSIRAFDQLVLAGEAATQSNYQDARVRFAEASDTFLLAERELNQLGRTIIGILRYFPVKGKQLASAEHLLSAGQAIALAGQDVTQAIQTFNPDVASKKDFLVQNNIVDLLKSTREYLGPAHQRLTEAAKQLEAVEIEAVPYQYREAFKRVKENVPVLRQDFDRFLAFSDAFYALLGGDNPKRYLMIFQNNRELRATGGFLGSLALVDIDHGLITKLEVPGGGPYDFQGQLKAKVISPSPLHLVNPHWYLQDANWFPDFPTTARKIMWFYEKSGGPTVDGVISFTPEVIINLLKISGPLDLQDTYGVAVTAENFVEVTLDQVEHQFDEEENRPKQFIADLLPVLLQRVFGGSQKDFFALLTVLSDALERRDILFYSRAGELQKKLADLGWGGEIKQPTGDYLMLVNSNISGGKTDAVIDQTVKHHLEIAPSGELTATVEVTRVHNGQLDEQWTGVKNIDFMRLYVPQGSQLIEATGFEQPDPKLFKWPEAGYEPDADLSASEGRVIIDERSKTRINDEFGKTVFGNWAQVEPGQSVTARFVYRLPFTVKPDKMIDFSTPYSLYFQRQPGSFDTLFRSSITLPSDYQVIWQWPDESSLRPTATGLEFETVIKSDLYLGLIIQRVK